MVHGRKLTEEQVTYIRDTYCPNTEGRSAAHLARMFGVSSKTILQCVREESYKESEYQLFSDDGKKLPNFSFPEIYSTRMRKSK